MRIQLFAIGLAGMNFVLLVGLVLAASGAASAQDAAPVVRARAIELVDDNGQVRARLNVEASGETVFRLSDARGHIRVKLGASEDGSGLVLADDSAQPGLHVLAKRDRTTLTLADRAGQLLLQPSGTEP
jgi:hypothetical protein